MRSWVGAVVCAIAVIGVAGQRDPNTRLGLLATDLGIDPVPGGRPDGTPGSFREDLVCSCLPINQVCPFDVHGRAVNPSATTVRITNTQPLVDGACPPNYNRCCGLQAGGGGPVSGSLRGACGGRERLQNYQAVVPPQADFGEYPWMAVVLDTDNGYLGGGVLIRNNWVLTAAHKVTTRNLKVRLGDYDLSQAVDHPNYPHLEVGVKNVIIHPNFNSKSLVNDVALLELDRSVPVQQYPHIGLACLPNQGQKFEGQRECFVSGWGKDAFSGNFQNVLKEVDVPIVERFSCQSSLRNTRLGEFFELDGNSFVCAGGIAGKDACTGDGGAPLVCRTPQGFTVVGLVAWGIGCAEGNVPGVYVNVANFANFIEGYTGPLF
uniref:Trypsin n=1 Tax=Macrophthalmus japonicus TaxID=138195 RepID=A0A068EG41_9EUCA|nr:trypsin [Macrophthalmus japonicus]